MLIYAVHTSGVIVVADNAASVVVTWVNDAPFCLFVWLFVEVLLSVMEVVFVVAVLNVVLV